MSIISSAFKPFQTYIELTLGMPYKTLTYQAPVSNSNKQEDIAPKSNTNESGPRGFAKLLDIYRKQRAMTSPEFSHYNMQHVESVTRHYLHADSFYSAANCGTSSDFGQNKPGRYYH